MVFYFIFITFDYFNIAYYQIGNIGAFPKQPGSATWVGVKIWNDEM